MDLMCILSTCILPTLGFCSLSHGWSAKVTNAMIHLDRAWEVKELWSFVTFYTFQYVEISAEWNLLHSRSMFYNKSRLVMFLTEQKFVQWQFQHRAGLLNRTVGTDVVSSQNWLKHIFSNCYMHSTPCAVCDDGHMPQEHETADK
jgi:hypothetical protein